jgi:AbrB family looped-hinge helix DNA binding protein
MNSLHFQKGDLSMELAKVTTKGQITIPVQNRKQLNIRDGDKVIFINEGGRIVLENSARLAILEAKNAFTGLAEELGLRTEEDVVELVRAVRKEILENRHANNA